MNTLQIKYRYPDSKLVLARGYDLGRIDYSLKNGGCKDNLIIEKPFIVEEAWPEIVFRSVGLGVTYEKIAVL